MTEMLAGAFAARNAVGFHRSFWLFKRGYLQGHTLTMQKTQLKQAVNGAVRSPHMTLLQRLWQLKSKFHELSAQNCLLNREFWDNGVI